MESMVGGQLRNLQHADRKKVNDCDQEAIKNFLALNQYARTRETRVVKNSYLC